MARVKQKVAKQGAAGASTRGVQVAKQKKHKIAVGGDPNDKKLPTVIAFTERPPPGYTFIPAGNPELTNALKEFARRGDHKIYVVTVTPHAKRHELSREIHRVGFHFPTTVIDQVCAHYGIRLNSKGELVDESKDDDLFKRVYQNAHGKRPAEKDQVTINTEAKQTIKDLFPHIPDNDLYKIIKTAFQLGDHKVGTAPELTLARRAQLSVVAHIRHNYTPYDRLLRQIPYNEARHNVEKETLMKVIEWRGGEDMTVEDTGRGADDLLKEVIVISDEESESDPDDVEPLNQEHVQVEELSSAAHSRGYGRSVSPVVEARREHFQHYPGLVRTYKPSDAEIAQRNQSRYAVWDQARRDYRSRIAQNPATVVERIYEPEPAQAPRIRVPIDPPTRPPAQLIRSEAPASRGMRIEYEPLLPRQHTPPMFIRDTNGNLFERVDPRTRETHLNATQRYYQHEAPAMTGALVRTRPSSPQDLAQPESRYHGNFEGDDSTILPSVEGSDESYIPPRTRRNPFDRQAEPREPNTGRQDGANLTDLAFIDLTNSSSQTPKRRRLEEIAPQPQHRVTRRESLGRRIEHQYLPQLQARAVHPERRAVEYGEPHYSPRLQPAVAVREDAYDDRQPFHDARDPARPVARHYEPMSAMHEVREPAATQSLYRSQNYGAVVRNDVESIRPAGDLRNQTSIHASRVYEPVVESRFYDSRIDREHEMPVREQYAQPPMQEARVRYIYADGNTAHDPVQSLPPQRVLDYDRPTATVRSYAR